MQFDDFYNTVGVFGRYQKLKYFFICLTYMLPPILVYTWTFTAATPSFRCRVPLEDISREQLTESVLQRYMPSEDQCREYKSQISIAECQRCYHTRNRTRSDGQIAGPLRECTNFIFDQTYYHSTLVEEWSMVCNGVSLKSLVQIIFFFGYMVGSLVFGILSDKYGRRPVMGASFFLVCLAGFLCAFAPQQGLGFEVSYALYAFGRFLLACATRGVALTGFVIGVEIVGPKQRLFTGIVIEYFFAIGELILLAFAYFLRNWRHLHLALAIVSIPFLFFYFILPESPRWLISKGRYDAAEKVFREIASTNETVFDPIAYERLIHEEKKREALASSKGHGVMGLLRSKVMCVIGLNMSFQWFVQNLVFYGVSQNTGTWLVNPYVSFAASALVEIMAYLVVHLTLDRRGRKLTYSAFVMGFVIVAFLVVPIQMLMIKNSRGQYILMFIVHVVLKFFASGSYAIIYIYANELFPTHGRNTGIGICSMVARLGAIAGTLFNDVLARVWLYFPIIVFGVTSLLAVASVTICPETAGKPLPQTIDDVERMGLAFLFCQSTPVTHPQIEDDDDIGENISLRERSKEDVSA